MSKTTDLFALSAAALVIACVAGWAISDTQARVAGPGADRSSHNDDERKTDAHRALRGLFLRVQLSEFFLPT